MKNFIITVGLIIIGMMLLIFQSETNSFRRDVTKVENAVNQAIHTGTIISPEAYKEGGLSYNGNIEERCGEVIKANMPNNIPYTAKIFVEKRVSDQDEKGVKEGIKIEMEGKAKPYTLAFLSSKEMTISINRWGEQIGYE